MSGSSQIFVKSFISTCHCGKVIPYGQLSCPGHGRYSRYFFKNNKLFQLSNCANCQSTTTYIHFSKRNGRGVAQWRHDEVGNLICKRCYDKRWRNNDKDRLIYSRTYHMLQLSQGKPWRTNTRTYMKIYNALYQPRGNQLRRERTAIKRGYGWTS